MKTLMNTWEPTGKMETMLIASHILAALGITLICCVGAAYLTFRLKRERHRWLQELSRPQPNTHTDEQDVEWVEFNRTRDDFEADYHHHGGYVG